MILLQYPVYNKKSTFEQKNNWKKTLFGDILYTCITWSDFYEIL